VQSPSMLRRDLLKLAELLATGALAAAAISLLLTGRVPSIPPAAAVDISLYLTLYALMSTGIKLGVDGFLMAKAAEPEALNSISLRRFCIAWMLPTTACCALFAGWRFGWIVVLPCAVGLWLDARAILIAVMLTGRGDSTPMSIGTLLNLPLFFALLVLASLFTVPNMGVVAALFSVTSIIRFLFLAGKGALPSGSSEIPMAVLAGLGLQQVLNFLLFRGDQVLLGLDRSGSLVGGLAEASLPAYLASAKFYEMACSVTVLICMVALPRNRQLAERAPASTISPKLTRLADIAARSPQGYLTGALVAVSLVALVLFWLSADWPLYIPFAVAAGLALPVNFRTFVALRQDRLRPLLKALLGALLGGVVFLVLVGLPVPLERLALLAPIQMLLFLGLLRR
jgi:hypothetical protein